MAQPSGPSQLFSPPHLNNYFSGVLSPQARRNESGMHCTPVPEASVICAELCRVWGLGESLPYIALPGIGRWPGTACPSLRLLLFLAAESEPGSLSMLVVGAVLKVCAGLAPRPTSPPTPLLCAFHAPGATLAPQRSCSEPPLMLYPNLLGPLKRNMHTPVFVYVVFTYASPEHSGAGMVTARGSAGRPSHTTVTGFSRP